MALGLKLSIMTVREMTGHERLQRKFSGSHGAVVELIGDGSGLSHHCGDCGLGRRPLERGGHEVRDYSAYRNTFLGGTIIEHKYQRSSTSACKLNDSVTSRSCAICEGGGAHIYTAVQISGVGRLRNRVCWPGR